MWVEFALSANASVVTVAKALVVSSSAVSSSVVLCPEYSESSSFPRSKNSVSDNYLEVNQGMPVDSSADFKYTSSFPKCFLE